MSRRFLVITPVLPWPLRRNGGAQRTGLLVRALQRHGEVDVFGVGGAELREDDPKFDEKLAQHNVLACHIRKPAPVRLPFYAVGPLGSYLRTVRGYMSNYQRDPAVAQKLAQLLEAQRYDAIFVRYLQPALQAGLDAVKTPVYLDFDDIDFATFESNLRARPWKGLTGRRASESILRQMRQTCERSMRHFRRVFVTSEEDQKLVSAPTTVLPNIPFSDRADSAIDPLPPVPESRELLFVGDLQFPPNRDGLDRFLTQVWPTVRAKVPEATISIVGRGLAEDRAARWRALAGTNVIGFAPDLVDCYRRCAFSIVPLYSGGGTKIKIIESLAFGRTVVTTTHAMRGYASLVGGNPAVAMTETDAEFADACVQLLTAPPLRDAMARRGRAIVEKEFSFQRFANVIDEALTGVVS